MSDQESRSDLERSFPGTIATDSGREPIVLRDPSRTWIVLSGSADLFLVKVRDGQLEGARHHVARIPANQAFFGVDHSAFAGGWSLIGCAGQSSRLLEISRDQASIPGVSDDQIQHVQRLAEQWIAALSASAAGDLEPKVYTALAEGTEIVVGKEPPPFLPGEGVVWVRHLTGTGAFLGRPDLPELNGAVAFPVCRPAWIAERTGNRLVTRSTEDELQRLEDWSGLDCFHSVVVPALIKNVLAAEEKEAVRLQTRIRADQARLRTSFFQLALPLRRKRDIAGGIAWSSDPLLAAFQAIGDAAGITFRPHPDLIRGIPLKDPVAAIARFSGVRFRRVVLGEYWWKTEGSPLLAFREDDKRPLALLPRRGRYEVYDPAEGGVPRPVTVDMASALEPFAYTFYRPFPAKVITATQLALFGARGSAKDVWIILLMGILGGLLGMATPILTGTLFDTIIPGAQRRRLLEMAFFLGTASISGVFFQLTRGFAVLRLEGKMEGVVQAAVWDRLLSLPVPFFRRYSAGDLAMRSLAVNSMRQILSGSAMSAIFSGIFSVFSFCLLFYYSWRMAIVALILTLIVLLVTAVVSYLQLRQQRTLMELGGKLAGLVLQLIVGIAKFRVSATENRAFTAWAAVFGPQKTLAMKNRRVSNWMAVFNSAFPLVSLAVIFFAMLYFMSRPGATQLTTGQFLAFNSAYGQFAGSLLQLTQVFIGIVGIAPLYERAEPILKALPEVDSAKTYPGELTGAIELSHVSFRYKEAGPLVLKDVSISIRPGEFVALVGPSGSGKSTIFRMLLGFETPETGALYLDGQELANLDIQSVRQQMGVVLQNASLFSGDVFSNIVCAAPYTIDEAMDAAKLAGLETDLQQMPMGMHTVLGDGGAGLSGGQRQRLMIARAVVGRPRILLFDEATSALDNQTQTIVSRSLENLKATRIVIAHRLSTIINADKIVVIENGAVVQSGTYGELVAQPGLFAELVKRQLV